MNIALCTLVLNEMEWLPALWEQHKMWPGMVRWVFVESADRAYAQANPGMVSPEGLSVDGTTDFLAWLERTDKRVKVIRHGFSGNPKSPAQGKCESRNRYLQELEGHRVDCFVTLDCDEACTFDHQCEINRIMAGSRGNAFIFRRREIWRPPSISHQPLFSQEVVGGFWDIPCCHWWRWMPGLEFKSNHNTPEVRGMSLGKRFERFDDDPAMPQMVHMGFAASAKNRVAKNRYYEVRGEATDPKRSWYVDSRKAFESWLPGGRLPHGASVKRYEGPVPEVHALRDHNSRSDQMGHQPVQDTNPGGLPKPVESPEFWKMRVRSAFARGGMLHQAILDDSYDLWAYSQGETAGIIRNHLTAGVSVLDAGCGYGALLDCLEEVKLEVRYTGVDISPDLIDLARERYPGRAFQVADLRKLPFSDGAFDWAVCRSVQGMIRLNVGQEAWDQMEAELRRVARRLLLIGYPEVVGGPVEVIIK